MRLISHAALVSLTALAACHASVDLADDARNGGDNVHIAMNDDTRKNSVSLKVPGLSANVTLPGINLGEHIDMDGIQIAPNTSVKTVDVQGDDDNDGKGKGADDNSVRIAFTNPGTPGSLIDYYRKAAADAGYDSVAATGTGVSATKARKQFALSVSPDGSGSRGAITMRGPD